MNYIFTNAHIFTLDKPEVSNFDSLLVESGKIKYLGSLSDCKSYARNHLEIIDLKGKALIPALTDCHTHFTDYAKKFIQLDLSDCRSIEDISKRMSIYRKSHSKLPDWVLGDGWDINIIDNPQKIRKELLDEFFPDIPVALYSKDFHSRWCNSLALKIAHITESTIDPKGGHIEKDSSGKLTGILQETASEWLDRFIIPPSKNETMQCLSQAQEKVHSYGLGTIHSMELPLPGEILEDFARQNKQLRIIRHFYQDELETMISRKRYSGEKDEWFQLGGLKLFADGSLGSQTAAIFSEYPNSPGFYGILRLSEEEMYHLILTALKHGFYTLIHCIGDRAVHLAINVISRVEQENLPGNLRNRLEHIQSIQKEDIPRLKNCTIGCSVQPIHIANDIPLINKYWQAIASDAYCFRSLIDAGMQLAFGSDAPIAPINPFYGIYSALKRKPNLNPKAETWFPEQCLNIWETLQGYTINAAKLAGIDDQAGTIIPGKNADLIVIEDFTKLPDEYWLDAESLLTMIAGEIVLNKLT
ncbi:MAG: amidohydrolase [Candidatus Cloacimonetes bacterium]|jgi:predicted amidohydrolase YtcJ|nr:amidohydrolase [Candidatus Cloacimonadota bacterium]